MVAQSILACWKTTGKEQHQLYKEIKINVTETRNRLKFIRLTWKVRYQNPISRCNVTHSVLEYLLIKARTNDPF